MAEASFVARAQDPDDRRAAPVSLTEKGRGVAHRINPECDAYYRELFEGLSIAQQQKILEAVELLAGAMRASAERRARCCRRATPRQE